jgi:hypothetical protein
MCCIVLCIYYRSDITDVITGRVLDLMYETNRESFVFKYLDLKSNEIELIALENLSTCDWDHNKRYDNICFFVINFIVVNILFSRGRCRCRNCY